MSDRGPLSGVSGSQAPSSSWAATSAGQSGKPCSSLGASDAIPCLQSCWALVGQLCSLAVGGDALRAWQPLLALDLDFLGKTEAFVTLTAIAMAVWMTQP